jgi:hypothetical protein
MKEITHRSFFDPAPCVHYQNPIGHFRDYAQIMGDQQNGSA